MPGTKHDAPTLKVVKLVTPDPEAAQKGKGRPRKLVYPPLPNELLDGMTPLEVQHFRFAVAVLRKACGRDITELDEMCVHMAALEYINLLRVYATQIASGEVISQARQHPGVQLRAWVDMLSISRKQRASSKRGPNESDPTLDALMGLSG